MLVNGGLCNADLSHVNGELMGIWMGRLVGYFIWETSGEYTGKSTVYMIFDIWYIYIYLYGCRTGYNGNSSSGWEYESGYVVGNMTNNIK